MNETPIINKEGSKNAKRGIAFKPPTEVSLNNENFQQAPMSQNLYSDNPSTASPDFNNQEKTSSDEVSSSLEEQNQTSTQSTGPKVMRVKKRDNSYEPVNVNKIINVVLACSSGLNEVDPMRVATKVISGLYDGASTKELDRLCIRTASFLISEDPDYSKLSARLLIRYIREEVEMQGINNFLPLLKKLISQGLSTKKNMILLRKTKKL